MLKNPRNETSIKTPVTRKFSPFENQSHEGLVLNRNDFPDFQIYLEFPGLKSNKSADYQECPGYDIGYQPELEHVPIFNAPLPGDSK